MTVTQERLAELLNYDPATGNFICRVYRRRKREGDIDGSINIKSGHVVISIDNKSYYGHRLAWFYVYGKWPEKLDHINRIPHDNRIENLREATQSQNLVNRRIFSNRTPGVYPLPSGRWTSQIWTGKTYSYLGTFDSKEEAVIAFQRKHIELHGKFSSFYEKESS